MRHTICVQQMLSPPIDCPFKRPWCIWYLLPLVGSLASLELLGQGDYLVVWHHASSTCQTTRRPRLTLTITSKTSCRAHRSASGKD